MEKRIEVYNDYYVSTNAMYIRTYVHCCVMKLLLIINEVLLSVTDMSMIYIVELSKIGNSNSEFSSPLTS